MSETGCQPTTSNAKLRSESVDFSQIPHQSRLFLQYQSDPLSLRKYYPSAVAAHTDVAGRRREVLESYIVDRGQLCDALEAQNTRYGATTKTFQNIDLLRQPDTVAVLTGQQTGLFTGPLYTVYKALSAIKMADCLRGRGIGAVPVFWSATEDHDFVEISNATLKVGVDTTSFELIPDADAGSISVGNISLPDTIEHLLAENFSTWPRTEFADELRRLLADVWRPGRSIGEAFCTHIQRLFGDYGLIVVDPLDSRLKSLAAPIYAEVIEKSEELVTRLVTRSKELEDAGYHAQVLVSPDYFPLFYHTDDGVRRSVRSRDGQFHVSDTRSGFTLTELIETAIANPERFSPGVMVRPVVQDYLFPTICYFGGSAEIAYFAQNSEAYQVLGRPATPILHRQSYTLVEPRDARALKKYGLNFVDVFRGFDELRRIIVERFVNPTTTRLFADAEEVINLELNRLDQELSRIDPTLADNLATRRRKISHHIAALRKKFNRVQLERDEIADRRLRSIFSSLLPEGSLQERVLNIGGFYLTYGPEIVDWIYDSIELDERGHRLLYL